MNFLFSAFGFIAYVIAAFELFESATTNLGGELHFVACGAFCAWGTASFVGAYVMDVLKAQRAPPQQ